MKLRLVITSAIFLCALVGSLVYIERYAARLVREILSEEVEKSCPGCRLQVDAVDISLLTLSGKARGIRMIRRGGGGDHVGVTIGHVRASVGVSKIFSRVLELKSLLLMDVDINQVDDESLLFKFIDQITAPPPPGHKRPFLKVFFEGLVIERGALQQKLGPYTLRSHGVSVQVIRNEFNTFDIFPLFDEITLHHFDRKRQPIFIGSASADVRINDDSVEYRSINLKRNEASASLKGVSLTTEKNAISGALYGQGDDKALGLSTLMRGTLGVEGILSGYLSTPHLEFDAYSMPMSTFEVPLFEDFALPFSSVKAHGNVDIQKGGRVSVGMKPLAAQGNGILIGSNSFVHLDKDGLRGLLEGSLKGVEVFGVEAREYDFTFLFGEDESGDLSFNLMGVANDLLYQRVRLGPSFLSVTSERKGLLVGVKSATIKDEKPLLSVDARFERRDKSLVFTQGSYSINQLTPLFENDTSPVTLTAQGDIIGNKNDFRGDGNLIVSSTSKEKGFGKQAVVLKGDTRLKGTQLDIALGEEDNSLLVTSTLKLDGSSSSQLTVTLNDFVPTSDAPRRMCQSTSGSLLYQFSLSEPLKGNGEIKGLRASLGCDTTLAELSGAASLPIKQGTIDLSPLVIKGSRTDMRLFGTVGLGQGWNAQAKGSLDLLSLRGLVSSLDELRGLIEATIKIDGPLGAPSIFGSAHVAGVALGSESSGVQLSELSGDVTLKDGQAHVASLLGKLNGGIIEVTGNVVPDNLSSSELKATFADVAFAPSPEISVEMSGQFTTSLSTGLIPRVSGVIDVTNAEFYKSIGLQDLIESTLVLLRGSPILANSASPLPDVELSLKVNAPQGLFVTTTIAEAELQGSLTVEGTLEEPRVSGVVTALSGWFGFRDKRFYISSGELTFRPEKRGPEIDLIGESSLRSSTGENVQVLVEVQGEVLAPRISFTSDRGLSQSEILGLVAGGGSSATSPLGMGRSTGFGLRYNDVSLVKEDSPYLLDRFLYRIVSLDSFSVEPTFEPLTGTLQPAISAEKRLSEFLNARATGLFAANYTRSETRLEYQLTDRLLLSGGLSSITPLYPAAAEGSLSYMVFTPQNRLVLTNIEGNRSLRQSKILEVARLKDNSRVRREEVDRITLLVQSGYRDEGFFEADIRVRCERGEAECRELLISINEGSRSKVASVRIEGLVPEGIFTAEVLKALKGRAYATREYLERAQRIALRLLRRDGYLGARVEAKFADIQGRTAKDAILTVYSGRPVSFAFYGLTKFTSEEILESLNLSGRKQPFGSNSIAILVDNCTRLYQEKGYFDVKVTYQRRVSNDERVTYDVFVTEGARIRVDSVKILGSSVLNELKIRERLTERDIPASTFFKPDVLVASRLDEQRSLLLQLFRAEGFPNAKVLWRVEPTKRDNFLSLIFEVDQGEAQVFSAIDIDRSVNALTLPEIPRAPLSQEKAELYRSEIEGLLKNEGYYRARVSLSMSGSKSQSLSERRAKVSIEEGPQAKIGAITIEGNSQVTSDTIEKELLFSSGAPLTRRTIEDSRRRLLKLSLFSKVEIKPSDGSVDALIEDMVVLVTERPLRSLSVGGGANSTLGIHLFGEAVDRKLWSDGRSLSARSDLYFDPSQRQITQGVANLLYSNPRFLETGMSHIENFTYQRITQFNQEFEVGRLSIGSFFYRPFPEGVSLSFGHALKFENLFEVSPDSILSSLDQGSVRLSTLSMTLAIDQRDDPLNPQKGIFGSLEAVISSKGLGSQANYGGGTAKVSGVYPLRFLSERFSVAGAARFGILSTFGVTDEVPITQRFYLGGRTSVRGFRENSLGPRGSLGNIIGGDFFHMVSSEMRYRVSDLVSLNLFLDGGDVHLRSQKPNLWRQRVSTGVGVRFLSPVGPIGFDVGHPLDDRPGEPSVRLHFTVGSTF
jgi:outer membrane protein insertion porin family